jgi:hypothetical protein
MSKRERGTWLGSRTMSDHEVEREAFADRLFRSALGYFDILSIHLGGRLGLYRTLAEAGPTTSHASPSARGSTNDTRANGSSSNRPPGS